MKKERSLKTPPAKMNEADCSQRLERIISTRPGLQNPRRLRVSRPEVSYIPKTITILKQVGGGEVQSYGKSVMGEELEFDCYGTTTKARD